MSADGESCQSGAESPLHRGGDDVMDRRVAWLRHRSSYPDAAVDGRAAPRRAEHGADDALPAQSALKRCARGCAGNDVTPTVRVERSAVDYPSPRQPAVSDAHHRELGDNPRVSDQERAMGDDRGPAVNERSHDVMSSGECNRHAPAHASHVAFVRNAPPRPVSRRPPTASGVRTDPHLAADLDMQPTSQRRAGPRETQSNDHGTSGTAWVGRRARRTGDAASTEEDAQDEKHTGHRARPVGRPDAINSRLFLTPCGTTTRFIGQTQGKPECRWRV